MESQKELIYLGIDVSKGYADFELYNQAKERLVKGFKLYDTRSGHEALLKKLKAFQSTFKVERIVCGLESTGGYENNWYRSLSPAQGPDYVEVYRLNPVGVNHQGKSEITRTVTDSVSAKTISLYLIEKYEKLKVHEPPSISQAQARRFYHYITKLTQQKTRLSNQLEKVVYDTFPELIGYMRHGFSNWLLELLNKYPSSGKIKRARMSSLLKIKGINRQKAASIKAKAAVSIGLEDDILLSKTIAGLTRQIIDLKATIKQEKAYLAKHYTSQEVKLLEKTKGIGGYTAIGAMMEIEDIDRFGRASSLVSYFGIHPEYKESGDGKIKAHMSKKGRPGFRAIMYMAARNVVNHNDYFKEIYAKFRAKGMNDGQAIGVIMHKLTRVFFGILKSGKPFDPEIDKANRNRSKVKKAQNNDQAKMEEAKRELEQLKNAPCSNRAIKRKKMEVLAHTSDDEVSASSHTST